MGLSPDILMQLLSAQPQQGQQPVQPGATPGTTPPFMGGPSGIGTGPMLQQAMAGMSNPQGHTIPQPQQPVPPGAPHPILQQILRSLGTGMQNFGYGAMTGPQQQGSQELEAKKAETMANLAATQQWREGMLGLGEQKVGVAQQRANTAEEMARTQSEKVKAYEELGQQRNKIMAAKSDWQQDIAKGNLDVAIQKMAQQNSQFEQSINQRKDLFEQNLSLKQEALDTGNLLKESAQEIMRTAMAQKGTLGAAEVAQKLTDAGLGHFIQNMMGNVPGVQQLMGTAQQSGVPGVAAPAGAPGTPSPGGTPPMPPTGAPPTPQAKAAAKSKTQKPSGGGKVITYDAQGNRIGQ